MLRHEPLDFVFDRVRRLACIAFDAHGGLHRVYDFSIKVEGHFHDANGFKVF